tara:strand:- start:432 stop:851 length:420 start_codon:yes stop_codon:yes gene_type:complete
MGQTYIQKITPKLVDKLREELQDTVKSMEELSGLKTKLKNAVYSDNDVTFKLEFRLHNAPTQEMERLVSDNEMRKSVDFMVSLDLDKVVKHGFRNFKLCGFRPRAKKSPYIVEDVKTKGQFLLSEKKTEELFGIKGVNK